MEFLSPGTEADDLGETVRRIDQTPRKWDVYEKYLRIPYYAVYDRYDNRFRLFQLAGIRYQEVNLLDKRFWFEELELGLGIWSGRYEGADGLWLRWYDSDNQWIPTEKEEAVQQRQRAEAEQQRAERAENDYQALLKKLQDIDPNSL